MSKITWEEFERVELRAGTIIEVEDFPEMRKPSYKLKIDFGKYGIKSSSAQITKLYSKEDLINKKVICVTNFPPKHMPNFISEVLTTGFVLEDGKVILATPDMDVPNGTKLA